MIRGTNPKTGKIEVLNARQIKQEILSLTEWEPEEYNKNYALYRNKLRNYETITGAQAAQKVNEVLLSSLRREAFGQPLTPFQSGVAGTTSASTSTIKRAVARGTLSAQQQQNAFSSIEATYANLLDKTHYYEIGAGATLREVYNEWLNEVIGTEYYYDENGARQEIEIIRAARITPAEVEKFLRDSANALHNRQRREYQTNKAYYDYNRRKVGS